MTTQTVPEEIAERIKKHYEDNPKHGVGCACLDAEIRVLREHLSPLLPRLNERLNADDEMTKVYGAYTHVVNIASRRRDW